MLEVDDHALFYPRLKGFWPRSTEEITVTIRNASSAPLIIPLLFIASGGNNTWGFVHQLLSYVVNEEGELLRSDGAAVDLDEVPTSCEVEFAPVNVPEFTWAKGPQSGTRGKPAPLDTDSDLSIGAGSSSQNALRDLALVRDGWCLLSGDSAETCDAAHLVPKSRSDLYSTIIGKEFYGFRYLISMAVLLNKTSHSAYDRFQWSFYFKDDVYYVHVFGDDPTRRFHGKAIPMSRFRVSEDEQRPDPRLCEWHYAQCVQKYLRFLRV